MVSLARPPFNVILEGGEYRDDEYISLYKLAYLSQLERLVGKEASAPIFLNDGENEFKIVYHKLASGIKVRDPPVMQMYFPLHDSPGIIIDSHGNQRFSFPHVHALFTWENISFVNEDIPNHDRYLFKTLEEIEPIVNRMFLMPEYKETYRNAVLNKEL